MSTFIRYMAATDESPVGIIALEYLKALLRLAPVRLVSMSGTGISARWERYAVLLGTPMRPTMVSVVCCDPARWTWKQHIDIPVLSPAGHVIVRGADRVTERISRRYELYTEGCRNVLLAASPLSDYHQVLTAQRYEALVVPTTELAELWRHPDNLFDPKVEPYFQPTVITVPVTDHDALRRAVLS